MDAANPCPICSQPIPERPRGSRHGNPPKTCSEACRKERTRRIERERYHRVKESDGWKSTREAYLLKLQERMRAEPEFAERRRIAHRRAVKRHLAKLSPEQRQTVLLSRRLAARKALDKIRQSGGYAEYLNRHRQWYASLTDADYQRLYHRPRSGTRKRKNV
jgi:hypothetical protein